MRIFEAARAPPGFFPGVRCGRLVCLHVDYYGVVSWRAKHGQITVPGGPKAKAGMRVGNGEGTRPVPLVTVGPPRWTNARPS